MSVFSDYICKNIALKISLDFYKCEKKCPEMSNKIYMGTGLM